MILYPGQKNIPLINTNLTISSRNLVFVVKASNNTILLLRIWLIVVKLRCIISLRINCENKNVNLWKQTGCSMFKQLEIYANESDKIWISRYQVETLTE